MRRGTKTDHRERTELSDRLLAVASMVTTGSIVCDVGCDHGYVSIYLVNNHVCPHVIAMDVNAGPLGQAREHIREAGLLPYIDTRRSDGLKALKPGEADSLIIAGMGGRLMERILHEGREQIRGMQEVILQPQSEIASFRKFLREQGYRLLSENMIFEDGKYYPMMKAAPCAAADVSEADMRVAAGADDGRVTEEAGNGLWQQVCDRYGGLLLKEKHPVLHRFLLWERDHHETIMGRLMRQQSSAGADARRTQRIVQLEQESKLRRMALSCYEE